MESKQGEDDSLANLLCWEPARSLLVGLEHACGNMQEQYKQCQEPCRDAQPTDSVI